jgi:hypothetical protein
VSKYKIIITLILFCFFQTTPSISLELKLPKKLGDLKKITEDIKKELEKKEPEVKKEEVKKEEVKKKEVKKKEVKKEEVKKEEVETIKGEDIILNRSVEFRYFAQSGDLAPWSQTIHFYEDFTARWVAKEDSATDIGYISGNMKWEFTSSLFNDERSAFAVVVKILTEEDDYGKVTDTNYTITIYHARNQKTWEQLPWNDDYLKNKDDNIKIKAEYSTPGADYDIQIVNIYDLKEENTEKNIANLKKELNLVDKNCEKIVETTESDKKSKTLGGYKEFYFGMSKEDVKEFAYCKKELNNKILISDFTQERGKAKGYFIQDMYKYNTGVRLKDGKVNSIDVQLFVNIRKKTFYSGKASEEFEQIKKAVLDKYELIAKPTKVSIDEFNSEEYGRLEWVLKSNIDDNLILLIFKQSPGQTKYFYTGMIDYLSSEESKIYRKELDSKVVKSDDL